MEGFVRIPNSVIRGSHGAFNLAVLMVIRSHGECWASLSTLAKEIGCGRTSVVRGIVYWMKNGQKFGVEILRESSKGRSATYRVDIHNLDHMGPGVVHKGPGTWSNRDHKEDPYKNTKEEASNMCINGYQARNTESGIELLKDGVWERY